MISVPMIVWTLHRKVSSNSVIGPLKCGKYKSVNIFLILIIIMEIKTVSNNIKLLLERRINPTIIQKNKITNKKSKRGRDILCFNDLEYTIHRVINATSYYRCRQRSCLGRDILQSGRFTEMQDQTIEQCKSHIGNMFTPCQPLVTQNMQPVNAISSNICAPSQLSVANYYN
ncbi:uncharacterized protein LOC135924992 isoform X1 [Gordionus sp. m RMFG-2023]|uniref:uncharacterized protein LOC135924992 isoform X1 n=1 Tax=Gordionus sp. m RMFG-2023 TaxID=3053472 RepID=UPI0031FC2DC6